MLSISKDINFTIPPVKPYKWEGGKHDIELTRGNLPLIGMLYIFEGVDPPAVGSAELLAAKTAAEAPAATADVIKAYDDLKISSILAATHEQMSNWFLVLVACQQVRDLSQSNIDNFARMCKTATMPSKALQFVSYWAANTPSLAANASVREKFETNKFFEYHTTGSSTPALCLQAMEEVPSLEMFSKVEADVIQDALNNAHSLEAARLIPDITLVKVRAILEAAGTLPEVWYMGDKAVAKYSGKKYSAIVKIVKQIFKLQTDLDGIDTMDIPTLVSRFDELTADQDFVETFIPE
jgi:hypothetical protein